MNKQDIFYRTSSPDHANYRRKFVTHLYGFQSTPEKQDTVERRVLCMTTSNYTQEQVEIGPHTTINTVHFKCRTKGKKGLPLVMVHGFAVGLGTFAKNLDTISKHTEVYAIDLLGFGRSSRPTFSKNCLEIIQQYVQSLEDWRKAIGLRKFILLGHSFGSYLSTWYALRHPGRIAKLILVEPFGFQYDSARKRQGSGDQQHRSHTIKERLVHYALRTYRDCTIKLVLPYTLSRLGINRKIVKRYHMNQMSRYNNVLDADMMSEYILRMNSLYPSGEKVFFRQILISLTRCREPILPHRIILINGTIPIDFIYGQDSWMSSSTGKMVTELIENEVKLFMIPNAGHEVHLNNPRHFNDDSVFNNLIWF